MSYEKQKEIFNRLVSERALKFTEIKDKIDLNNLVFKFSGSENKSKDFGNYQMSLKLFEDLRDGNINLKEVLKNQARFKSDFSEIKVGGKISINQKKIQ